MLTQSGASGNKRRKELCGLTGRSGWRYLPDVHPVLALYYAAVLLLLAAGLPKIFRPQATARSLSDARLPDWLLGVRIFAAAEIALALGAVLVGGRWLALAIALLYVAFAGFVLRALRIGGVSSCGCFAGDDAPPSVVHVVLNGALAVVAGWTATAGGGLSLVAAARQFGEDVTGLLLLTALLDAFLLYLVMTRLRVPASTPEHASAAPVGAEQNELVEEMTS